MNQRNRGTAAITTLSLSLAAMAIGISACSPAATVTEGGATAEAQSTMPASSSAAVPEVTETEEVAAPETTEAPESEPKEVGTRSNPAVMGEDTATFTENGEDVWEVSVLGANTNANKVLTAENPFNELEGEGTVFVMVELNAKYLGTESADAWLDIQPSIVTESGRSYDQTFAVAPESFSDIATLYEGGEATGNVVFEVPKDEIAGAVVGLDYGYSGEPLFFGPLK